MDVSKFKASRARLTAWIMVPVLLLVGSTLSTDALRRRSERKLSRTRALVNIVPRLTRTHRMARELLSNFRAEEASSIRSEDELISFLQNMARTTGFTVDSLTVKRNPVMVEQDMVVLTAAMQGVGSFASIQEFLGNVVSSQHLLSCTSLKLSQRQSRVENNRFCADISFELVLCNILTDPPIGRDYE